MNFFYRNKLTPDWIIGDFDSASSEALDYFGGQPDISWIRLNPVKDDTDTESAIRKAIALGAEKITLLGATGTRIDHLLGNIELLGVGDPLQPCLQARSDARELSWNYRFVLSGSRKGEVGEHRKAPLHDQPWGPYRSIAHYPLRPCSVCPG